MKKLAERMSCGKKALIAYFTVGYPSIPQSAAAMRTLLDSGADCLEIGIPFSDPLADGPTIQAASNAAIRAGGNLRAGLEVCEDLRRTAPDVPIVIFTYYNPVYRMGLMNFARNVSSAGADAVLVPDLPIEEAGMLNEALVAFNAGMVFLAAPTSTERRLRLVQERSSGFVYAVSVTGVTGERTEMPDYLPAFVERIKAAGKLPVAVGFGVSGPGQAAAVARCADGVVVGIAFLNAYDAGGGDALASLAASLVKALDGAV